MCSIIGCFSPKSTRTLDFKGRQMLTKIISLNKHRGGDGAGLWTEKGGLQKTVRMNLPLELAKRKNEKDFLLHLRKSTNGGVIDRLCHPFVLDEIAYCHNGHISNYDEFGAEMDSLAGLFAIAKGKKEIEKLVGWYVFAWYDMKKRTINLLNHNGSIQYGWYKKNLVFASEGLDKVIKNWYTIPDNKWYVFKAFKQSVKVVEIKSIRPKKSNVFTFQGKQYYDSDYYDDEKEVLKLEKIWSNKQGISLVKGA